MSVEKILNSAGCEMEVVCGKRWEELDVTEEDGIHFCNDCKKLVFYTETSAELRLAAERGLCVYIVPGSSAARMREPVPEMNFEISRERIREIEAKALKRMKGPTMGVAIIKKEQ